MRSFMAADLNRSAAPGPEPASAGISEPCQGSLPTIAVPMESANPLISNETEKRRNHRQKSSKVVKNRLKSLNQKVFE
jgi:hypothetical protein